MIEQFEAVLKEKRDLIARKWAKAETFRKWQIADNERWFKRLFPKKRKHDFQLLKNHPEFAPRIKRWNEHSCKKWGDVWAAKEKPLQDRLEALAETTDVPVTAEWLRVDTFHSSSWSSQGFGSMKYAKGAASRLCDHLNAVGVETEIRTVNERYVRGYGCGTTEADYEVWAKTTETGFILAKLKPGISLVERVRLSWKRGVNPRVDLPFLPHDFEDKHGLDYFGGFKKKEAV